MDRETKRWRKHCTEFATRQQEYERFCAAGNDYEWATEAERQTRYHGHRAYHDAEDRARGANLVGRRWCLTALSRSRRAAAE